MSCPKVISIRYIVVIIIVIIIKYDINFSKVTEVEGGGVPFIQKPQTHTPIAFLCVYNSEMAAGGSLGGSWIQTSLGDGGSLLEAAARSKQSGRALGVWGRAGRWVRGRSALWGVG